MSAAAGGRADPSRDADHLQLVEQTRELIKENRELRQRAQVPKLDPTTCVGFDLTRSIRRVPVESFSCTPRVPPEGLDGVGGGTLKPSGI